MNKIKALEYLVENSVYEDEWSGVGMYNAVEQVIKSTGTDFDTLYLDILLQGAKDF